MSKPLSPDDFLNLDSWVFRDEPYSNTHTLQSIPGSPPLPRTEADPAPPSGLCHSLFTIDLAYPYNLALRPRRNASPDIGGGSQMDLLSKVREVATNIDTYDDDLHQTSAAAQTRPWEEGYYETHTIDMYFKAAEPSRLGSLPPPNFEHPPRPTILEGNEGERCSEEDEGRVDIGVEVASAGLDGEGIDADAVGERDPDIGPLDPVNTAADAFPVVADNVNTSASSPDLSPDASKVNIPLKPFVPISDSDYESDELEGDDDDYRPIASSTTRDNDALVVIDEDRPFKCSYPGCEKAFKRSHDRDRHKGTHDNKREHSCLGCRTTFKRKDALNRHLRSCRKSELHKKRESDCRAAGTDAKKRAELEKRAEFACLDRVRKVHGDDEEYDEDDDDDGLKLRAAVRNRKRKAKGSHP